MRKADKKALRGNLVASLQFAIADCYFSRIVDSLVDEVAADIDNLGREDYGAEDVKQAAGRVLCKRLKIDSAS